MKMQIVAVRDIVSNAYSQPQFALHIGQAKRAFGDQCRSNEGDMGRHPEDFEIWHLGEFDDNTGQFELLETPVQIDVGSNYRRQ